jgi:hypothetical protein
MGEVDPSWPPPRTDDVERDSSAHSEPRRLLAANEVDPNWPPPVDARRGSGVRLTSGRVGGIWLLAALTTVVGIVIGVAVTLALSHGGRSEQQQGPAVGPASPALGAPNPAPNGAPGPTLPVPPPPVAQPPEAVELPVNPLGYVQIGTQSGKTRCDVMQNWVGCETAETNWPMINGHPAHGVKVTDAGQLQWEAGNLGRLQYKVTLSYQTYRAMGWTIAATTDGTTFTNDRTGHGMSVSIERVSAF